MLAKTRQEAKEKQQQGSVNSEAIKLET